MAVAERTRDLRLLLYTLEILICVSYSMCFRCLKVNFQYPKTFGCCKTCHVCHSNPVASEDRQRWGTNEDDLEIYGIDLQRNELVDIVCVRVSGNDEVRTYHGRTYPLSNLRADRRPVKQGPTLNPRIDRVCRIAASVSRECFHRFLDPIAAPTYPMVEGMANGRRVGPLHLCSYCFHYPKGFTEEGLRWAEWQWSPANISVDKNVELIF